MAFSHRAGLAAIDMAFYKTQKEIFLHRNAFFSNTKNGRNFFILKGSIFKPLAYDNIFYNKDINAMCKELTWKFKVFSIFRLGTENFAFLSHFTYVSLSLSLLLLLDNLVQWIVMGNTWGGGCLFPNSYAATSPTRVSQSTSKGSGFTSSR